MFILRPLIYFIEKFLHNLQEEFLVAYKQYQKLKFRVYFGSEFFLMVFF